MNLAPGIQILGTSQLFRWHLNNGVFVWLTGHEKGSEYRANLFGIQIPDISFIQTPLYCSTFYDVPLLIFND